VGESFKLNFNTMISFGDRSINENSFINKKTGERNRNKKGIL